MNEKDTGIGVNLFSDLNKMTGMDRQPKLETLGSIEATLALRGSRYGSFEEHARITQNIKVAMQDSPNWDKLPPNMKESLEMIAHKVGRILNGDPFYHDSWHDMVGYAKLVADEVQSK